MLRRRLGRFLICCALIAWAPCSIAWAQEVPVRPLDPVGNNRSEPDGLANPSSSAEVHSPGTTAPPVGSVLDPSLTRLPPFHLTRVTLDGEVVGDRASLTAEIDITVNVNSGWHRVPLRLNQAHVWSHQYDGPGMEAPALDGNATDEGGLVWLIKGMGLHRLKLSLWVPIRRSLSGRELQLALPPLPPQFEATLRLTIPEAPLSIRLPKETTLLESVSGNQKTELLASIAGERMDLKWQPANGQEATASQVLSTMNLRRSGNRVALLVDQVIQFDQKSPRQLQIRLPRQFQLIEVSGGNFQEYSRAAEASEWLTVHFDEILTDRTDLRWQLEAELPATGRNLTLEGFEVRGAPRQDGVIRIDDFGLFEVRARGDQSQLVQRSDPSAARGGSPGTSLSAYKFSKQPFRLSLDVIPVVPTFAVSPAHDVHVHLSSVVMTSRFRVDVDSGAVQRIGLTWPLPADRWVIQSSVLRVGADEVPVSFSQTSGTKLELSLPAPLTGSFEVELVTERSFDPEAPVEIRVPLPDANYRGASQVRIFADDQLQTVVRSMPETAFTQLPVEHASPADLDKVPQHLLESTRQEGAMVLQATVHQRTIHADLALHVDELTPSSLALRQRIDLNVEYGRVNHVLLTVPEALTRLVPRDGWPFAFDVQLDAAPLPTQRVTDGLLVLFPQAVKGNVSLQVAYRFPLDPDGAELTARRRFEVPLLDVQEARRRGVRCQVHPLESVQIEDDPHWAAVQTSPEGAIWVADRPDVAAVPLTISPSFIDSAQQYSIEQAFVQTRLSEDGQVVTAAAYRLLSPPSRIVVRLPSDAELDEVHMDGEALPRSAIARQARREGHQDTVTISLFKTTAQRCILSLSYHSRLSAQFGLSQRIQTSFPQFPSGVWTDETIWQVELPPNHHLFQSPLGLIPEFHWSRSGVIWKRRLSDAFVAERQQWGAQLPSLLKSDSERCYAYRHFGPVTHVELSSMNRSLVLLAGAGTTLLLGFVFWGLPWTRNILSLVTLAFLFAVASLWYLEPMLLMLQPALFGIFLAALATVVDAARRPERLPRPISGGKSSVVENRREAAGSSATHIPTTIYRPSQAGDSAGSQR